MALQTALAKVTGGVTKESKVRVLFDSGSNLSFVTARAVEKLGLRPVRREKLETKVFGSDEVEVQEGRSSFIFRVCARWKEPAHFLFCCE